MRKRFLAFSLISFIWAISIAQNEIQWTQIEAGLEYSKFETNRQSPVGDRKIDLLRIDPNHFQFELIAASEHGNKAKTAKEWTEEFKLTAAVNAGMFQMDGLRNVGYFRSKEYINNPSFNADNCLLAFEPKREGPKLFNLIDRECSSWKKEISKYNYVCQGIRMVDCKQNNKWAQQDRIWSMVIIGMDKNGNAIIAFCRSPYSVHDLIDILLASDLNLYTAMYLEGGPEASLCLRSTDLDLNLFGSYETGFFESDENNRFWPIPNIIGIRPRILDKDCNPILEGE